MKPSGRLRDGDSRPAAPAAAGASAGARDIRTPAPGLAGGEPGLCPRLLDVKQAGAYLGVSPWTVRELAWRGELPEVRIGRRLLFDIRDLDGLVERNKRTERP